MKVLLTGGMGLLGLQLLSRIPLQWNVVAALHRHVDLPLPGRNVWPVTMDITDPAQARSVMAEVQPDVVIHAASVGDIDYCERNKPECWRVNVEGTRFLLELSKPYDPLFVFISTIYVFDGENPPYDEASETNPINCYARSKVAAEQLVLQFSDRPVILRPQTMYGWHHPSQRTNCVTWLLAKLERGEAAKIVEDVYNNFLWVGDAAQVVIAAVQRDVHGIFHVGSSEAVNRYELSLQVADIFGFDRQMISPITSDYFSSLAPRPKNTFCSIEKLKKELGVTPCNIEQGLQKMKRMVPVWAGYRITSRRNKEVVQ